MKQYLLNLDELIPIGFHIYPSASATHRIITVEDEGSYLWNQLAAYVDKHFGVRMDNKTTIHCKTNKGFELYITFWDTTVSIGTDVDIREKSAIIRPISK